MCTSGGGGGGGGGASELAGLLEKDGHSVAVVDKRPDAFRRLPTGFSGQQVVGFGFDRDTLIEAGVERAGALAAVTSGDNSNIMSARVGRETFEIERVVARIYDPRRAAIYQRTGIPTVATVSWTTDQIIRRLIPEGHESDWVDPTGHVCLVERAVPSGWAGRKLSGIEEPGRFSLVAITREGTTRLFDKSLVGQDGDLLRLMVEVDALQDLQFRLEDTAEAGGHH